MSDREGIPEDLTPPSAYLEALRQQWDQRPSLRGFHRFARGETVIIDLTGIEIDGVQLETNQRIAGELLNNVLGYIWVTEANGQPELVDHAIGVGADIQISIGHGKMVANTIQHAVFPGGEFLYYDPKDTIGTQYGCVPPESLRRLPLRYARLQVGDVVDFDVSNQ